MRALFCASQLQKLRARCRHNLQYHYRMRVYLPITQSELVEFISTHSHNASRAFASTSSFRAENLDCDQEEIEYLLSILAAEVALKIRVTDAAPGLLLALELDEAQCGESHQESVTLTSPIMWDQVQCALLAYENDDELIWFATQEISQEIENWK